MNRLLVWKWVISALVLLSHSVASMAEPFLAIETGLMCSQCHINPTGGGLRTSFGALFSQTQLPARPREEAEFWAGSNIGFVSIGANGRFSGRVVDTKDTDDNFEFDTDRVTLYINADVGNHVRLYIDQQLAPDNTFNREAWVQIRNENWYLKAGKFFLPYGLRIEDDNAYIRQSTGFNFDNADDGLEVGFENNNWSGQLSVTNGTSGRGEVDDGKQVNLRVSRIMAKWRIGFSASVNDTDAGDRTIFGIHTGFRIGPSSWLFEIDRIEDDGFAFGDLTQDVALLETDLKIRPGHYLRLTAEIQSFDLATLNDRFRYGIEYKYFPYPFTELRVGYRKLNSDDDIVFLNSDEFFIQAHVFF